MRRFLLTHAIDAGAEKHPERTAVKYGDQQVGYGELAAKANQVANHLTSLGVQRGDRVGIYMAKGLQSAISLYGIMKAGAAYVPLDPLAPSKRIQYVVNDCDIQVILTNPEKVDDTRQLIDGAPRIRQVVGAPDGAFDGVGSIDWDELWQTSLAKTPAIAPIESDLAYILYTSGSTGMPKGIMHSHRSGLSFAEWAAETYQLLPEDRVSNHAPLHFDLSTFDYFASHIAGASVIVVPEAITKFPASMTKLMEAERVSVWYSVPFALIQMLLRGGIDKRDLSSLRWVLFAGEPFPIKHLAPLMQLLDHARFSNLYGPTETNVCTYFNLTEPPTTEPMPIGIPCSNVEALVVDGEGLSVGKGNVGELLIRGGVVMRGYWGDPDRTQLGFFERETASGLTNRFYRTGDLVREDDDGNLIYLGRKDRQVKTRGYRVELDEVEVALLDHETVEQAAVFAVPDGEGSNLIAAAVVLKEQGMINAQALLDHAALRIPQYAIPVRLEILDALPRTSTGKIDRMKLAQAQLATAAE